MMRRWSECFIPTLREAPLEAEVPSHKFLLRAGYVRQHAAGYFSYLFLGRRSMLKIEAVVRKEMDRIGQEFSFASLASGQHLATGTGGSEKVDVAVRQGNVGDHSRAASSADELVADIARRDLRSYKQLPQVWYQINTRFHGDTHPRFGLLGLREGAVCDSRSLDVDAAGLDAAYREHFEAYCRILRDCGLKYVVVDATVTEMPGARAQEFMVYVDAGPDGVATCSQCGYAANVKGASSMPQPVVDSGETIGAPIEVETPTQKTIEDVAAFLGVNSAEVIKSYLAVATSFANGGSTKLPVMAFLRGDHSVNDVKLRAVLEQSGFLAADVRLMSEDEIRGRFGLEPGFIGPVGLSEASFPEADTDKWLKPRLLFDFALKGRRNLVAGANKPGFHLIHVTPNASADFLVRDDCWVDIRNAVEGEGCPHCSLPLVFRNAIKVGYVAKLSSVYSGATSISVTDGNGREVVPRMGKYGLWLDSILAACIEQDHDDHGFWLSPAIAPFCVVVTATNTSDEQIRTIAESITRSLDAACIDVLLDDRDERPGVKFKDADLSGIPYRINVGKRIAEGEVELFTRQTSTKKDVRVEEVVALLQQELGATSETPRNS